MDEVRYSGSKKTASEPRDEYRRDRDRVYYSDEFRRLEGVTQVASAVSGRVHNRMTHSYRVEQIARSIAISLDDSRVNEEVVAAAALAHDLGHPPFGHNGEQELQEILICPDHRARDAASIEKEADLDKGCDHDPPCLARDSFEGNAQTFHMVATLAAKAGNQITVDTPDLSGTVGVGLDLTRRTLAATLKYPWLRGSNAAKPGKWSVYDQEKHIFNWVNEGRGEAELGKPSLEAQVMDVSDDIAYAVHDVEDFFRLGVIPLWQIRPQNVAFDRFMEYLVSRGEKDNELAPLVAQYKRYRKTQDKMMGTEKMPRDKFVTEKSNYRVLEEIWRFLVHFPVARYEDDIRSVEELAVFRSQMITQFVSDIRIDRRGQLAFKEQATLVKIHFLKQLTWFYAIENPHVQAVKIGQRAIVRSCFRSLYDQAYRRWAMPGRSSIRLLGAYDGSRTVLHPRLVSYYAINKANADAVDAARGRRAAVGVKDQLARSVIARSVVDYMCSLSDAEIYDMAAQLRGSVSEKSVLDAYSLR